MDITVAQRKWFKEKWGRAACHTMSHFLLKVPGMLIALSDSTARKISGHFLHFLSPRVLQVLLRLHRPRAEPWWSPQYLVASPIRRLHTASNQFVREINFL